MDALKVLHERRSVAKLTDPAPDEAQRRAIFSAALRAADHGRLRPWRFLVIEGRSALLELGDLLCRAAVEDNPEMPEAARQAQRHKPLRAPTVVVAIARCQDHPSVPEVEQLISAGAGVQNMLNAAHALGLGAFWRTGAMAYHPTVRRGLGLASGEHIVGFLYLGTPASPPAPATPPPVEDFFTPWPAP